MERMRRNVARSCGELDEIEVSGMKQMPKHQIY